MKISASTRTAIDQLLSGRIARLRGLSLEEVKRLPEAADEMASIPGGHCSLTVFRQALSHEEYLVVAQVSVPRLLGSVNLHIERGLIFKLGSVVRDATELELVRSGG